MEHKTVTFGGVRVKKEECLAKDLPTIMRCLRDSYEHEILARLLAGEALLDIQKSMDLSEPGEIRLPVRIKKVGFNDGINDGCIQYEVWGDLVPWDPQRVGNYLSEMNRRWVQAQDMFETLQRVNAPEAE